MPENEKDWGAIKLEPGAELIVGWRPRRSRLDAGAVELSEEVANEIHDSCEATLTKVGKLRRRPFGGAPYIEAGEEYLAVPATELPRAQPQPNGAALTQGGPRADEVGGATDDGEAAGLSDLERLVGAAGLKALSRDDLQHGRYLFYAAICTQVDTKARIGFVRQTDPHRVASEGGLMARFSEGLQKLDDPVFIFDADFDLLVSADEIAVLRIEAFNRMFADLNTIIAAAPANAQAIAAAVAGITPESVGALAGAAATRPSLARRLQRLRRPGAVPAVTPRAISEAMVKHGLDPRLIVAGEAIEFDEEQAGTFLDLLEQLYYETDFTAEHRRADRYSPLGA